MISPTGSDHMELTLESGNEDASAADYDREAEPTAKRHTSEIDKEIQRLEKLMRDFRDTIQ